MTGNLGNAIDPGRYRKVLGQYPTGVCVVTGMDADGGPVGMVVGSFTSLSLDPPLVAFMIDKRSTSWPRMRPANVFCINVLGEDQEDVCRIFASKGVDKFSQTAWEPASSGSPILDSVVAWIDCDVHQVEEGGDHEIVIGLVRDMETASTSLPLLFFRGGYGKFAPLSMAAAEESLATQLAIVDTARTGMERVARRLQGQLVAMSLVDESLVFVASAGDLAPGSTWSMVGQRFAAVPPIGSPVIAWSGSERIERWLRNVKSEATRDIYRTRLAASRERGYSVMVEGSEAEAFMGWVDQHEFPPTYDALTDAQRLALENLPLDPVTFGPDDASQVRSISVPVVTPAGDVPVAFALRFRPGSAEKLASAVEELQALAESVASELERRRPKGTQDRSGRS